MTRESDGRAAGDGASRRRSRRGRTLLVIAGVLALLALLLASPFVLVRLRSVRDPLLRLAQARAGLGADLRLRVDAVDRMDPFGLELRGVVLERRVVDARWERISRIGRLSADWSPVQLAAGQIRVGTVAADTLELWLPALNAYLLRPEARPRRTTSALQRSWAQLVPPVTIGKVQFSEVRLVDREGVMLSGGLTLTGLASSNRGLEGTLARGRIVFPRAAAEVALGDGRVLTDPEGATRLEGLRLESGGSRGTLDVDFDPRVAAFPLRVRFDLERLLLADVERWIPPAIPRSPGDSLAGRVNLRRGPAGLSADAALHGRLEGESLEELRAVGHAGSDTVRLSEIRLRAALVSLTASGEFLRSHRSGSASLAWHDLDPRSAWVPWLHAYSLAPGISGEAEVSFVLPAHGPPVLDGRADVSGLAWDRLAARRVRLLGQVVPGRFVRAESLAVDLQSGRMRASGFWPFHPGEGEADLFARFDSLDLSALPRPLRIGVRGTVSGEARVHGPVRDLTVEGAVTASAPGWREWHATALNADRLLVRVKGLDGAARVQVTGLHRAGDAVDQDLFVRATRAGGLISAEARLVRPGLEVELAGEADPRGSAVVRRGRVLEHSLGAIELDGPWRVRWSADSLAVDTLRLVSPLARLRLAGRWSRRDGGVQGEVGVSGLMLDHLAPWLGSADTLRGACAVRALIGGRLPDPTIDLDLACDEIRWGPLDLGRLSLVASWRDRTLWVEPLTIEGPAQRVSVPEFHISADRPLVSLLRPDAGQSAVSLADLPCTGRIEIARVEIAELTGLAEVLDLPVSVGVSGVASQLLVAGEAVPLRVIVPGETVSGKVERGLGGLFQATIDLTGTPRAPRAHLNGGIEQLRVAGGAVGDVRFAAAYADSMIEVEQFDLVHEGRTSWVRGRYPLRISLLPPMLRPTDAAAGLQAELNDLNLALVSAFTRYIPDASGRLGGTLAIAGTGRRPRVEGTVRLREGGFRIPERSERIYGAEAQLDLGPEGLRIRSLDARIGPRGTLTAVGTLRGPNDFDLNAHVENARVFETGRYEGVADGDLNAYTMIDPTSGSPVPHLDGVIEVREFTITQDLARKELTTPGSVIPWMIDLDVAVPGNVRVSQVNASAELGEGQLHLSYRWPLWNLSGSVRVLGGTYRLLNNAFTIKDGSVEFRDTGAGPDLTVSADAETYVAVASEGGGPAEAVTVTVHVEGKPEAMQVSLSSQPPMSQEDIVELLSVGRLTRTGRFEPGAQTQWILLNTMVDRIENSLLQQSRIFSRVTVAPGTTGEEPLKMTLRPVVTPAFLVNYSQDLSVDPARELSINYRLSRFLFLRAGVARDRQAAGGFNDEYSLDLKCRFEYR